jgi:isoleucyl-tRNA synthetase
MDLYSSFMTVHRMRTDDCIWVSAPFFRAGWSDTHYYQGHALNKIIKDIINRFNVLLGRKVQ